ncbi:hypothetical protein BOS5A_210402 [Bosea sp. EC-HK365B]|nr:hypothetical protein BOSE21B_30651 [Bosea sp. 21B]CAD5279917.1 hypothetical protein BOSE46_40291 [Bosea sp. 46]VVT59611.1 hypothetical protein BOS5A_210402 [Bosea sp. EC-HK365B]VXC31695.1 hypothetical protein BOSE29B_30618 [Bosea sp. 29B]VXC79251.1 hypothetical protein BOSE125_50290 [Bosea sp. 125]
MKAPGGERANAPDGSCAAPPHAPPALRAGPFNLLAIDRAPPFRLHSRRPVRGLGDDRCSK